MVKRTALTALLAVSATVAGCSIAADDPVPDVTFEAPVEALQSAYDQRVSWESCADDEEVLEQTDDAAVSSSYSCATVTVPLNYEDIDGETIELRLVRYSSGKGKEPLVYNPGGPGGGAIDSLPSMVDNMLPRELTDNFDIVAPDPRGVGLSTPIECFDDEEIDRQRSDDSELFTVAGVRAYAEDMGEKCLEKSPNITRFADSESAARDLDIIRAALGQEKLNYLGFSYGTFLGALYADLFPDSVGRFVLDGAMDPAASIDEVSREQARGFEAAIGHWIETEQLRTPGFPLVGSVDQAKAQLRQWLDTLDNRPIPTADSARPLTRPLALSAILAGMYSTDTYEYVSVGLQQAMTSDDGSILLQLSDLYSDRDPSGRYTTNSYDAFNVINFLDYQVVGSEEDWLADAKQIRIDNPTVGSDFGLASAMASGWPIEPKGTRRQVTGEGAAPILVVGTTHDPATPYLWAEALASQLESATLLTWEGWSHCAYSQRGSTCIADAVNKVFLSGKLPTEGTVCSH